MQEAIKVSASRVPGLDGLRALSIVAVIGFHGGWPGFQGGGRGVDLFFVISGFLITSLLVQEKNRFGSISLRRFYARRALRILPAYATFLFCYALVCLLIFTDFIPRLGISLFAAATFTTNIAFGWLNQDVLLAHTWSLSLEEQFYLLFPLVIALASRRGALFITIGLLITITVRRIVLFLTLDNLSNPYRFAYSPDCRFDGILWGCLVALMLLAREGHDTGGGVGTPRAGLLLAGVALVLVSIEISERSMPFFYTIGYTATTLGFCLVLIFVVKQREHRVIAWLELPTLRYLGKLSYALYLWHPLALGLALRLGHRLPDTARSVLVSTVYLSLSLGFAGISYLAVESPFLEVKKRYVRSKKAAR